MKKLFTFFLALTSSALVFAQAPQMIKYQGVARDVAGAPIANGTITVQFDIHTVSPTGTIVYSESHVGVSTNLFGLFSINMGSVTPFPSHLFGAGNEFLEVSVDFGSGLSSMGTSQFLSVPYALYADSSGTPGPTGAQGVTGAVGTQGPIGNDGPTGAQGVTGAVGTQGPIGNDGPTGAQGVTGVTGAVGTQGPIGNDGPTGAQGVTGAVGTQGPIGNDGPTGAQGVTGVTGAVGTQGPIGNDGPTGAQGVTGAVGTQGPIGNDGPTGAQGVTGAVGTQGPIGNDGPTGAQGATGAVGTQGPIGNDGATGAQGVTGAVGAQGPIGNDGAVGPMGPMGPQGITGAQGPVGPQGSALGFADFFALMPGDNAATVAAGAAVDFPQDGPTSNTSISRLSTGSFLLTDIGVYSVYFQVSVEEAGQLILTVNGVDLAYTVVGRATGTSEIVGMVLIQTTVLNSVLTVSNPAGNPTALTITPMAGGSRPVSAHIVITRIQ